MSEGANRISYARSYGGYYQADSLPAISKYIRT